MFKYRTILFLFVAGALFTTDVFAQDLHPSRRASPLGMARTFVGDTYVKVTYGQPYMRGRDNIFGSGEGIMHPDGNVWRFGANEPTELTLGGTLSVGGTEVAAGTYTIFATPGAENWMVHINDYRGGNAGGYKAENNLASIEVPRISLDEDVDQFTIAFVEAGAGVHMVASWTDWEIRVPIMP